MFFYHQIFHPLTCLTPFVDAWYKFADFAKGESKFSSNTKNHWILLSIDITQLKMFDLNTETNGEDVAGEPITHNMCLELSRI